MLSPKHTQITHGRRNTKVCKFFQCFFSHLQMIVLDSFYFYSNWIHSISRRQFTEVWWLQLDNSVQEPSVAADGNSIILFLMDFACSGIDYITLIVKFTENINNGSRCDLVSLRFTLDRINLHTIQILTHTCSYLKPFICCPSNNVTDCWKIQAPIEIPVGEHLCLLSKPNQKIHSCDCNFAMYCPEFQ